MSYVLITNLDLSISFHRIARASRRDNSVTGSKGHGVPFKNA
jgi:hypothetical protein